MYLILSNIQQSRPPTRLSCDVRTSTAKRRKMMCMGIRSKAFLASDDPLGPRLGAEPQTCFVLLYDKNGDLLWFYYGTMGPSHLLLAKYGFTWWHGFYHDFSTGVTIVMNLNQAQIPAWTCHIVPNNVESGEMPCKKTEELKVINSACFPRFPGFQPFGILCIFWNGNSNLMIKQWSTDGHRCPAPVGPVGVGFHHGQRRLEARRSGTRRPIWIAMLMGGYTI